MRKRIITASPPRPWVLYLWIQPTADGKYFSFLISESSKKQNMNFPCTGNYLYQAYIIFTTVYTAFALF